MKNIETLRCLCVILPSKQISEYGNMLPGCNRFHSCLCHTIALTTQCLPIGTLGGLFAYATQALYQFACHGNNIRELRVGIVWSHTFCQPWDFKLRPTSLYNWTVVKQPQLVYNVAAVEFEHHI